MSNFSKTTSLSKIILDSRGSDHPEIQDYVDFVIQRITDQPSRGMINAFVRPSGECLGYTEFHLGNPHYFLSYCLVNTVPNPLLELDKEGAIKIKNMISFKAKETPLLTYPQISTWKDILSSSGWDMFNLGWNPDRNWYTISQIREMDIYMINRHLSE